MSCYLIMLSDNNSYLIMLSDNNKDKMLVR